MGKRWLFGLKKQRTCQNSLGEGEKDNSPRVTFPLGMDARIPPIINGRHVMRRLSKELTICSETLASIHDSSIDLATIGRPVI